MVSTVWGTALPHVTILVASLNTIPCQPSWLPLKQSPVSAAGLPSSKSGSLGPIAMRYYDTVAVCVHMSSLLCSFELNSAEMRNLRVA